MPVLERVGVAPTPLRARTLEALEELPKASGGADPTLAARRATCSRPPTGAPRLGDDYLSIEHLLLTVAAHLGVAATTCWWP